MASEAVLKYLMDTNRPYSCADVTVNLRGAYSKTVVQKTLDALSEAGKIKCKLYGKQKVYAAIQLDTVDEDNNVEDYDTQLKTLTKEFADKSINLKALEIKYKNLISTPTTDAAKAQIEEIKKRIDGLEKKLDTLKNSTEILSADEKKTILDEHEKLLREYRLMAKNSTEILSADEKKTILDEHENLLREYRKRKRISSDMLDAILEGYPKSKKNLIEELCVETDEMVNFKLMTN